MHGGLAPASFNIFSTFNLKKRSFHICLELYLGATRCLARTEVLFRLKKVQNPNEIFGADLPTLTHRMAGREYATHFSLHGKSQSASAKFWTRNCLRSRMFWMLFRSALKTTLNVLSTWSADSLTLKTPRPRQKTS